MGYSIISGPFGLYDHTCECKRPKHSGCSFCRQCYNRLPPPMRKDLYKTFGRNGEGYENSFFAARKFLIRNGVFQKRAPITFGLEKGKAS